MRMYTDGSKVNNADWYWAVLLNDDDKVLEDLHGGLGQEALVFQAECYAIIHGAELCKGRTINKVSICVDNQAVLHSLNNPVTQNKKVEYQIPRKRLKKGV